MMNDQHHDDFRKAVEMLFGAYNREAKDSHVKGYWAVLSSFTLDDVRKVIRETESDTLPNAKKLAALIRNRQKTRVEGHEMEPRDYHYIRPNDVACRRCRLRVTDLEALRVAGQEEQCPPVGRRLRVVEPPADRDQRRQWYRDRENDVQPGSAWDRYTYAQNGERPTDDYEWSGE